jgi:hypothetical protein
LVVVGGIFIAQVAGAPWARAEGPPPRPVVVVDVVPDAAELDATRVREAIGAELGADAVSKEDARGSRASGEIRVFIDRAAGQLIVVYRGAAGSIERRIDLGPDRAANQRSAVLLAGNLARDEAGDLVAQLRKKALAVAPAAVPTPAPRASVSADGPEENAWEDERLRLTLLRNSRKDRDRRLAIGWVSLGLGAAAIGGGAFWASQVDANVHPGGVMGPALLIGAGAAASGVGLMLLLDRTRFEDLSRYYDSDRATGRPLNLVREDVEKLWTSYANEERARTRTAGWVLLGAAIGFVGLGVAESLNWGATPLKFNFGRGASDIATGAIVSSFGLPLLLGSAGPIESGLRDYRSGANDPTSWGGDL